MRKNLKKSKETVVENKSASISELDYNIALDNRHISKLVRSQFLLIQINILTFYQFYKK